MKEVLRAHLLLFMTGLIGGLNFTISKLVMPEFVQPSAIILIRGFSAIIFFWLIHFVFIREKVENRKDLLRIFICALFGITANQILFYEGLNLTSPINAALLQCAVPIFVLIIAAVSLKEKITTYKIMGLLLGASGAILLLMHSHRQSSTQNSALGDLLVLLNACSYAIFLVLVKPLTEKYNPFTVVKWVFLFGTIMSTPFGLKHLLQVQWADFPTHIWLSLAFIIVFATLVNYYFNIGVLRYVNPSIAGIYIYLQPVFATIIAVAWGKDTLTAPKVAYSLMIFAGVYFVSKKKRTVESEKLNAKAESKKLDA